MSDILDNADGKIGCRICGSREHVIKAHLASHHPEMNIEQYTETYPDAPILSDVAKNHMERKRKQQAEEATRVVDQETNTVTETKKEEIKVKDLDGFKEKTGYLHQVFDLGDAAGSRRANGGPIGIQVFEAPEELNIYIPAKDEDYVFPIDVLKVVMAGLMLNKPIYLWGHAGTGKSTIFEQIMARTGRPWIRVQHTRNTEESHVLGQWIVKDGATQFELGPLPYAMKHGLTYLADEYDFAMPSVMALYQPVLEGKALVIKDADMENRIIKPHPMFRFVATGNTNGTGDETGLYSGTLIQNAANYERFGIVKQVHYIDKETELKVVVKKAGIPKELKSKIIKMIDFATSAREAFGNGRIGIPPSPRAMINAAENGIVLSSFEEGIRLAYINRLSMTDKAAAEELLKRMAIDAA